MPYIIHSDHTGHQHSFNQFQIMKASDQSNFRAIHEIVV